MADIEIRPGIITHDPFFIAAKPTRDRQTVWESSPAPGEFVISSVRKPVRAGMLVLRKRRQ